MAQQRRHHGGFSILAAAGALHAPSLRLPDTPAPRAVSKKQVDLSSGSPGPFGIAIGASVEIRKLPAGDVSLVAAIDRSEHVDVQYTVIDGRLMQRPVTMTEVPPWDPTGSGPHSVAAQINFCASAVAGGAVLLGAFDRAVPLGLAVIDPAFEAGLAWLAFLHVGRPHRRKGAASGLWDAAVGMARSVGAESVYVSATPTGSAVGFYMSQGCRLADPVHPALFAAEPDDIHLVCSLR